MLTSRTVLIAFLAWGLSSCSLLDFWSDEKEDEPLVGTPIPRPDYSIPGHFAPGADAGEAQTQLASTSLEEIFKQDMAKGLFITDADDPDKPIEGLEQAFKIRKADDWETNLTSARREAMRNQKPIILWFAHSKNSRNSTELSVQVFGKKEFTSWADENVVRVRIDANTSLISDSSVRVKREDYIKKLTRHFNVTGYPRVFILTPDGQQVDDLRGYISGTEETYLRKIKNSSRIALENFQATKTRLAGQGFRDWRGTNGLSLFAKPVKYYPNGSLILQEADGNYVRTSLGSLSREDQQWIAREKEKSDARNRS